MSVWSMCSMSKKEALEIVLELAAYELDALLVDYADDEDTIRKQDAFDTVKALWAAA